MIPKTLALREAGDFYLILKNKPSIFDFKGGVLPP